MYHLLQLYSDSTYSLERLLNPSNYTKHVNDYSLSWFVSENLKALNYHHLQENADEKLHQRFAVQLEAEGMWEWALFVLSHIKDRKSRDYLLTETINRNIQLKDGGEFKDKENFAIQSLKIPERYFLDAKGHKSFVEGDFRQSLTYYIASKNLGAASKVFWKHVVAFEMANENYGFLRRITQQNNLLGLPKQELHGTVFTFIQQIDPILRRIKKDGVERSEPHIIRIVPRLISICNKIIAPKYRTHEQILLVGEMGKTIIHLLKLFLVIANYENINALVILSRLAEKLPVPADYTSYDCEHLVKHYEQILFKVLPIPN